MHSSLCQPKSKIEDKQAGAELCQAQFKLGLLELQNELEQNSALDVVSSWITYLCYLKFGNLWLLTLLGVGNGVGSRFDFSSSYLKICFFTKSKLCILLF